MRREQGNDDGCRLYGGDGQPAVGYEGGPVMIR
ncbi:MAG: hypothetical protein H6Q02_1861, partial [Acidobacteria bacterium]|nr:hypothetical protein [Acidobacteriota bacterium]